MTAAEYVIHVVEALERLGIPFMVVGSMSSNIYGIPRSTKDADFVIQLGDQSISGLATALGTDFKLDPQASFETVTGTTKYQMKHRDTDFVIEFFALSADAHDQTRFSRRVQGDIGGRRVYVPTAEDVIIMKLRWAFRARRPKDLEDLRGIFDVQAGQLDLELLRHWADLHGTRFLLDELMSAG
jgi:hypothetical protein